MRSARLAITAVALLLVASPALMLGAAWAYERIVIARYSSELELLSSWVIEAAPIAWPAAASENGVWVRQLDARGEKVLHSVGEDAVHDSLLGGVSESLLELFAANTPTERLQVIDSEAGPLAGRAEVASALTGRQQGGSWASQSGQTVVVSYARPMPSGGVLLLAKGNHRGVRQIFLVRQQLGKLFIYELAFAALSVWLLARWLVRPLERLTAGAAGYPSGELADAALLSRRDEVGQLARALTSLAQSLEGRRQATVELAADVAHELKNPLATIAAASELIASTQDPSPEKRSAVHATIRQAVHRLQATTDALLKLERLQSEVLRAPRDAIDYGSWLSALLDTYRADPRCEGWVFALEAGAELRPVHVAAEAWASLMRNLLDNALLHGGEQRVITVRARRAGSSLVTEVADSGPGVSEGNRDKIFRRFFTARPEGAVPGTGLGLSIVEAVARAHGGEVVLLPASPGAGAVFRVTVPV